MARLEIDLRITARTAVAVGAGGSAGSRVDRSIVRDAWGRPLIPGSQLKGRVRHAAEQILSAVGQDVPAHFDDERATLIRDLFGSPEHPSPLFFHDLPSTIMPEPPESITARRLVRLRPSVALSRRRRIAEESLLVLQEVGAEGMIFAAEQAICGEVPDEPQIALLWAALKLADRWGGGKSRGLGWTTVEATIRWDGVVIDEIRLAQTLRRISGGR
ncbi:MAG: hypothetical protein HC822_26960 [Oscillochloris sp.]|nr:hypothetical protein [Oscillochloris sp.]